METIKRLFSNLVSEVQYEKRILNDRRLPPWEFFCDKMCPLTILIYVHAFYFLELHTISVLFCAVAPFLCILIRKQPLTLENLGALFADVGFVYMACIDLTSVFVMTAACASLIVTGNMQMATFRSMLYVFSVLCSLMLVYRAWNITWKAFKAFLDGPDE